MPGGGRIDERQAYDDEELASLAVVSTQFEEDVASLTDRLGPPVAAAEAGDLIREHVARVDVKPSQLSITMRFTASAAVSVAVIVPWTKRPSKMPREILRPVKIDPQLDPRPIRSETRATPIRAIATGRAWLAELVAGEIDAGAIAVRENCSVRQVNRIVSLAFFAPDLVQAAVDGRLPRGIGVETLRACPLDWQHQRVQLGLAS